MEGFPKQDNVLQLLNEAAARARQLGRPYNSGLLDGFVQAKDTLDSAPEKKNQLALLLSAARMLISKVEKEAIRLIIGDDPITSQEMSHLVRIRLICAELITLLTSSLDRIKGPLGSASAA
jgi:hypothetical protein